MAKMFGTETPRLWTKPLRPLTDETTLGFEVIAFALEVLNIRLYPWQKWLLIHALELLPDGGFRFQRVIVLVARQNGKTLLGSILTAWWLFVDSGRMPERLPEFKFKIVGVAQNLDIAREPWAGVKMWCNPDPETIDDAELALPILQNATNKVIDTNGKEAIYARSRAHYEIRAAANSRGKPAPRVLMDEMREQKTWAAWNAISQTLKSFGSLGQLWGISNAGDALAVVLSAQREIGLRGIELWSDLVESGVLTVDEFRAEHDVSLGLFEWSAPDDCALDDVDAILQANPSIGHSELTVQGILADLPPALTESGYRTEVLCQWVTARVDPFIDPVSWADLVDEGSVIAADSRLGVAVDVSFDRRWAYIAVAGYREDGLVHVELIAARAGMLWLPDRLKAFAEKQNVWTVALQARGTAAGEYIPELEKTGFDVLEIAGATDLGAVPGRFFDLVEAGGLRHTGQPLVSLAVSGAEAKRLGEVLVWDRAGAGVDIAPLVAVSEAVWCLERLPDEKPRPLPPPPSVSVPVADLDGPGLGLVNLNVEGF